MSYIKPENKLIIKFILLEAVTPAKFEPRGAVPIILFKFIPEQFIIYLIHELHFVYFRKGVVHYLGSLADWRAMHHGTAVMMASFDWLLGSFPKELLKFE